MSINPRLVETDPTHFYNLNSANGLNAFTGPWEFNGFRYFMTSRFDLLGNQWAAMWRTADGIGMELMDFSHAPTCNGFLAARLGNTIHIGLQDTANHLAYQSFDLASGQYGTLNTNASVWISNSRLFSPWYFLPRADGSFLYLADINGGGFTANTFVEVVLTAGGVWNAPQTILVRPANAVPYAIYELFGAGTDQNGTLHFAWFTLGISANPNVGTIRYANITTADVLSAITIVATFTFSASLANNGLELGVPQGIYNPATDTLWLEGALADPVSFTVNTGSWPTNICNVVVSSASTAPSVSVLRVGNIPGTPLHQVNWDGLAMWRNATTMFTGLTRCLSPFTDEDIPSYSQPIAGGGCVSAGTLWDFLTSPPPPASAGQIPTVGEVPMAPVFLANGAAATLLGIDDNFTSGNIYYLEFPAAAVQNPAVASGRGSPTGGGPGPGRYGPRAPTPPNRPNICIEAPQVPAEPECSCCESVVALLEAIEFWL